MCCARASRVVNRDHYEGGILENMTINIAEGLLIAATVAGPILAVQAQKFIERIKDRNERKRRIFYVLMATRATKLSLDHVQNLNMIELEFGAGRSQRQSASDKKVITAWRTLLDEYSFDGDIANAAIA